MSLTIREGEPIRFSLASPSPLPPGLLAHTHHVFEQACAGVQSSEPAVNDLHTLSLVGRARTEVDGPWLREQLRGPAIALKVDAAMVTGAMATDGPGLIVTDVDSTFIANEVIEMLAGAAGSEEQVREITSRAMAGELDFAASLRERVATLSGVEQSVFEQAAARVIVHPGARELIGAVHGRGGAFGLVSGGFHEVVDQFAAPLGVDRILANRLEVDDRRLTGRTSGQIIDGAAKTAAVRQWASDLGVELDRVVAMGDGANDLGMMEISGLSVAFCAKPIVLERADAAITVPRLDILIALLGWDAEGVK
ncbi:MAG: phosphoserine phosphatase SerB [Ancrocorticia sp.]|uniref:phosphoserine phosphatase SerB n=1 Tax=Ancrocorticia sp. TaxID=2593684 RepID=UPI003F8E87BA